MWRITMSDPHVIGPASPYQELILNSNARILLGGGAIGASKTYIGLMRHLRWVGDSRYRGFVIRKNMSAITKSGGIFDEAEELYRKFDPGIKIKLKDAKIVFSNGAEVAFSHYENTQAGQNLYQGLQIDGIFVDEAAQFEEAWIWWLFSRLRGKADTPRSIWLSANPDPDSFLLKWVEPYIYPKGHLLAGRANPEVNGQIRYFIRRHGYMMWGDTPEQLKKQFGEKVRPVSLQVALGTIKKIVACLSN